MIPQSFAGQISAYAASLFGVRITDVLSRNRSDPMVRARQAAMSVLRDVKGYSLPRIGRAFDRDHTTVLHALRSVERLKAIDDDFFRRYQLLFREAEALHENIMRSMRQKMNDYLRKLGPRIDTSTVCTLAGYGRATLKKRIKQGRMPPPIDRGREDIFDRDAVFNALRIAPPEVTPQW